MSVSVILGIIVAMHAILGAIFGSFLLVVALRYNTGRSLKGRSQCFSCGATLRWFELIPIVSYLIQGGRCRHCGSRIPIETLGAEVLTALLFGLIAARGWIMGDPLSLVQFEYVVGTTLLLIITSILMVVFFYDVHHKIIPDQLSIMFALFGLIGMFFFGIVDGVFLYIGWHIPNLWHALAGLLVPLPFVLLWLLSRGRWIGLGDPKLMVGMGWLLGIGYGFSAVFVSFWLGTLVVIAAFLTQFVIKWLRSLSKHRPESSLLKTSSQGIMGREIPFGPFLILGTIVTIVFGINLFVI